MPSHNSHLTTEQLSAFLDQQLPAQEQSTCQTHLNICELCQQQLTELEQTVLLVRALPQIPLPRSFVLPESAIQSKDLAIKEYTTTKTAKQEHNRILVLRSYARTTMRIASVLVAVLGLFFILSGLLTIVFPNTGTSPVPTLLGHGISTIARVRNPLPSDHQSQTFAGAAPSSPPAPQPQFPAGGAAPPSNLAQQQPPVAVSDAQTSGHSASTTQQQPHISFFDPGTPEGNLSIGLLLFILGTVSVIYFTKLGKKSTTGAIRTKEIGKL